MDARQMGVNSNRQIQDSGTVLAQGESKAIMNILIG